MAGENFTLGLNMDWLPLQDTNGDGVVSAADITIAVPGRTASNTPVITSIGDTAILANLHNGLAAGNQITLEHKGDPIAPGTEIRVTYLGLEDLMTIKGVNDVEIPLRLGETGADTGVFEATVVVIDGIGGELDQPNANLDPTVADPEARPRIAAVHGGSITATYRDREPAITVTSQVRIALITAGFSGAPRQGLAPLTVSFKDESAGISEDITAWEWDFGDGEMSAEQNPTHTYHVVGSYTVSLTVSAGQVVSTVVKENYIGAQELSGQRFSEAPIEVLRERVESSGQRGLWQPTGTAVELEAWDRVEVVLTSHIQDGTSIGLMFPGLLDRPASFQGDFAFAQEALRPGETSTRAFVAPVSGSYALMVQGRADFSIVVTRYVPFVKLPVREDVNGDDVVDVQDLAIVARSLGKLQDTR